MEGFARWNQICRCASRRGFASGFGSMPRQQGIRLRPWAAGFSRASVRAAPRGRSIRRIFVGDQTVGATQTAGIVLVGIACWVLHRSDLLWPLIGLVVSLHFLPLGWLFSVRPYYFVGMLGTAVAITSVFGFDGPRTYRRGRPRLGLVLGGSAFYVIANAATLADEAVRNHPSPVDAAPLV